MVAYLPDRPIQMCLSTGRGVRLPSAVVYAIASCVRVVCSEATKIAVESRGEIGLLGLTLVFCDA